jgi:hypothetical protein
MLAVDCGVGHDHPELSAFSQVKLACPDHKKRRQVLMGGKLRSCPEFPFLAHGAEGALHFWGHVAIGKPRRIADDHVNLIARFAKP